MHSSAQHSGHKSGGIIYALVMHTHTHTHIHVILMMAEIFNSLDDDDSQRLVHSTPHLANELKMELRSSKARKYNHGCTLHTAYDISTHAFLLRHAYRVNLFVCVCDECRNCN